MSELDPKCIEAIELAEDAYDADFYIYSAPIDHIGFGRVVNCFEVSRDNAVLILTTNGGLANSAYQIARLFQNHYQNFTIFIPSVCKSAGTLLSIGAHSLVMSEFSELGPLDVQLYERDEIISRRSGLLNHSAFEALKRESFDLYEHILLSIKQRSGDNISFPVASQVAGEMATGLMAPIFEQISPNVIGSDYRDLQVAIHYGLRLAGQSGNIEAAGVQMLTESYPSHDFIIDKEEAGKLFRNVETPRSELWNLIRFFSDFVFYEHEDRIVMRLGALKEQQVEDADHDEEDELGEDGDNTVEDGSEADS
ncbi:SDH family Clp fold serine proteinase [Stappia indica]|uniref:Serine dehydrogenase proteinase n=1 Tax=Stappia indica TaxID=538381 RepID=A0A285T2N6_9HYPH|nr:hypothetical protein [Stappia indica]SOC15303.1 Serine dehydrogenase proteinase [Stappia indica]